MVRLTSREENLISFTGAEMLDGTPLFDIKPYIPELDFLSVEKKWDVKIRNILDR